MASAAITGTILDETKVFHIQQGGRVIRNTLTDAEWVLTVGEDNAITQALIDGMTSDKSEATGWNAVVKAGLTFNDVVRISATIVDVTLPAFPTYWLTNPETITVTIPDSAVDEVGASEKVLTLSCEGTFVVDVEKVLTVDCTGVVVADVRKTISVTSSFTTAVV